MSWEEVLKVAIYRAEVASGEATWAARMTGVGLGVVGMAVELEGAREQDVSEVMRKAAEKAAEGWAVVAKVVVLKAAMEKEAVEKEAAALLEEAVTAAEEMGAGIEADLAAALGMEAFPVDWEGEIRR